MTFRVALPVEIGGKQYSFGDVVELELDEAVEMSDSLRALEEDSGGNGEGH